MKYIKWGLITALVLLVGGFLHYTLPRHDIVRIVESEVRRVEFGSNSIFWGSSEPTDATSGNRDVKFISAVRESGRTIVYRNEDTGWGWPPYFKVNSADLQARAADLTSTSSDPQWVAVKRYGWRNQFFSIFPNAVKLTPVPGPDASIFPWFNVVFMTLFAGLLGYIWLLWSRFHKRRIEPVLEDMGEAFDRVDDQVDAAGTKARGLWRRIRDKFAGGSSQP